MATGTVTRRFPTGRAIKLDGTHWVFPLDMQPQVVEARCLSFDDGLLGLAHDAPKVQDFGIPLIP